MYVRAEEQPPLRLYKKENPVRKEHFHRAMHSTAIDKAGAVEQCCPIGQQLFAFVQPLIATQSGIVEHQQRGTAYLIIFDK